MSERLHILAAARVDTNLCRSRRGVVSATDSEQGFDIVEALYAIIDEDGDGSVFLLQGNFDRWGGGAEYVGIFRFAQ